MRRWSGAGAALCLALLPLGCSSTDGPAPPRVGETAPPYQAVTLDGDSVSLSSLRGKVVLLNLWATWCAPCRHETPFLQDLYEARRDEGFEIVGVSMDTPDQVESIRQFVDEYGVEYTILHDRTMRGMDLYRVLGLPATFLVDREGTLRWMRYGPVGETDRDFLDALEDALG